MVRGIGVALALAFLVAGCTDNEVQKGSTPPVVAADFDGLSQDCFDASVRVRSRNSIGSASAIGYIKQEGDQRTKVDSILNATHVEFETNKHVAGTRGTPHVATFGLKGN